MRAIQHRSPEDGIRHHVAIFPPRVYETDRAHAPRIAKTRGYLELAIGGRTGLTIVELGCGTLDVSGPSAEQHTVYGFDCNELAIRAAKQRWPSAHLCSVLLGPCHCDVLVLCEFLEHIPNPDSLVKDWLPLAHSCVISHPLNEDASKGLSAGEHQWVFDEADFRNWFEIGGHKLLEHESFMLDGGMPIILGRGEHN